MLWMWICKYVCVTSMCTLSTCSFWLIVETTTRDESPVIFFSLCKIRKIYFAKICRTLDFLKNTQLLIDSHIYTNSVPIAKQGCLFNNNVSFTTCSTFFLVQLQVKRYTLEHFFGLNYSYLFICHTYYQHDSSSVKKKSCSVFFSVIYAFSHKNLSHI